jgi:hypothetical protein
MFMRSVQLGAGAKREAGFPGVVVDDGGIEKCREPVGGLALVAEDGFGLGLDKEDEFVAEALSGFCTWSRFNPASGSFAKVISIASGPMDAIVPFTRRHTGDLVEQGAGVHTVREFRLPGLQFLLTAETAAAWRWCLAGGH